VQHRPVPDRLAGYGLALRRLGPADAEALDLAVGQSIDHLRPWMAWIANEPVSLAQRRAMLAQWRRGWPQRGEAVFGIFDVGAIAGTLGVRPRGLGTVEIGYWIHAAFTRRGLASGGSRLLTDLAFSWPDVNGVEIHHDKANLASAAVPRKLGFRLIGETADLKLSPAEVGIDCAWRIERDGWRLDS
jgi:ribosomal-protein-serine acetyltransferase